MNKVLLIIIIFSLTIYSNGQGICIIDEIKASNIKGYVIFGEENYPVEDAEIKIFKGKNQNKLIRKLKTDSKGYFEIFNLSKGKYKIMISYPQTVSLYIPLKISNKEDEKNISIKLGVLYGVPCGGGEVKLLK